MEIREFKRVFAKHANCTVEVSRQLIDGFVEAVGECLARGERIYITGFGRFYTNKIGPRENFDLQTRTYVTAPGYTQIIFKPSKIFREKYFDNNDIDVDEIVIEDDFDFADEDDI